MGTTSTWTNSRRINVSKISRLYKNDIYIVFNNRNDFPSLTGSTSSQTKQTPQKTKTPKKGGNTKQESKNTVNTKPEPVKQQNQNPAPSGGGKNRKKKNRMKKVDASEFFSFGTNLAGRSLEGPEY